MEEYAFVDFECQQENVGILVLLQSFNTAQAIEFLDLVDNIPEHRILTQRYQNLTQCTECVLELGKMCVGTGFKHEKNKIIQFQKSCN